MFESTFEIVVFYLMETIHVQLSYKTINFIMPEIFG